MAECLNCLGNPGRCTCGNVTYAGTPTNKITADAVERHASFLEDSGNKSGATMLRDLWKELEELRQPLSAIGDPVKVAEALPELIKRIVQMIEAIEGGAIDSEEIDVGDPHIPPHKFHEEWQHHASETLFKLKARP